MKTILFSLAGWAAESPVETATGTVKYKKGKDVDFEELLIQGQVRRAEISVVTGDTNSNGDGLLCLRENFLDRMTADAGEVEPMIALANQNNELIQMLSFLSMDGSEIFGFIRLSALLANTFGAKKCAQKIAWPTLQKRSLALPIQSGGECTGLERSRFERLPNRKIGRKELHTEGSERDFSASRLRRIQYGARDSAFGEQ